MNKTPIKPRVRFCWECGKKLYGNHHVVAVKDKMPSVILHKICFKELLEEETGWAKIESPAASCDKGGE